MDIEHIGYRDHYRDPFPNSIQAANKSHRLWPPEQGSGTDSLQEG